MKTKTWWHDNVAFPSAKTVVMFLQSELWEKAVRYGNGTSPCFIGDTRSNGCLSIVMLVYRSVSHFLCQKNTILKKHMSTGMQSPTSLSWTPKKTLPLSFAIFADGVDGLKHGKFWMMFVFRFRFHIKLQLCTFYSFEMFSQTVQWSENWMMMELS